MLSKLRDDEKHCQSGKTLIAYNTRHKASERSIPLDNENYVNFDACNQISNSDQVFDENEQILISTEQEHSKSADNLHSEHSLTKCQYCQTILPCSLVKLHAQTCIENMANQNTNLLQENLKKCQFCQNIFPNLLLEQHTQTCSRRKIHQCLQCSKVFPMRSKLLVHLQSHSEERLYSCHICSKPFKFKSGLSRHMKQQHSEIEATESDLCGRLQGIEYTSLQDDGGQNFKRFKTSSEKEYYGSLEGVNRTKDSDKFQMVLNESSQDKYNEKYFVERHPERTEISLRTLMQRRENSSHLNKKETFLKGEDHFENVIGKQNVHGGSEHSYGEEVNFRHDRNGFEIKERDLKQDDALHCEKEFTFEVKPRSSDITSECFSGLVPLVNMESCAETNVYRCEDCPKIFQKPSRLLIHKRSHSNEKLFACEICQQTFKYKGSLKRHVKEQHYGQGRKSLSMIIDEKHGKEQENCLYTEMFGNSDMYFANASGSNDGVFRHWKERHFTQERICTSMVGDGKMNKLEDCSSLRKINFENDNESLGSLNKNLVNENSGYLKPQLGGHDPRSLSKVFEEQNEMKNYSYLEKNEFVNDDEKSLKPNESLECGETSRDREILDEDETSLSMVFDRRKEAFTWRSECHLEDDDKFGDNNFEVEEQDKNNMHRILNEKQEDRNPSQADKSFENVRDTNHQKARDKLPLKLGESCNFEQNSSGKEKNSFSMAYGQIQKYENVLTSKEESSFPDVDNTSEKNSKNSESHEESDFVNRETKFEEYVESMVVVNSDTGEVFDERAIDDSLFVKTPRWREKKVHQCEECHKTFFKRSAWANHKRTHNDEMSFACEICWKYFKYKGSLSRHIKEQHYGLGRKEQGNHKISYSSQATDNLHTEVKGFFGPILNEVDTEKRETPKITNSCFSTEEYSIQVRANNLEEHLNETENRDSIMFDKGIESDTTKVNVRSTDKVFESKYNFTVEKFGQSDFVKEISLDRKRDRRNHDESIEMPVNLCINEKEDLNEYESSFELSLENAEQEERTSDAKQGKSNVLDESLKNVPDKLTCDICGKCFSRNGSLSRHVKEQHYGLGRKSLKINVIENQDGGTCSSSSGESNLDSEIDCSSAIVNKIQDQDGNYKDENDALRMVFVASGSKESGCSPLADHRNNCEGSLSKTVNDVEYNADDYKNETFKKEESNFKGDEGSFKDILDEAEQKENYMNRKQDDFDGEQASDATLMENGCHSVQEKGNVNKNGRCFEDVLEAEMGRMQVDSKGDSFDVYDKNIENSPPEMTCDICGTYFKHKGSLHRHVKEQHYGLGRKCIKVLSCDKQRNRDSHSAKKNLNLQYELDDREGNLNHDKERNLVKKNIGKALIFSKRTDSDKTSSSHVKTEANKARRKDESCGPNIFELKESNGNEQNVMHQKDDVKKNEDGFRLRSHEIDYELSRSETIQDLFDVREGNVGNVHLNFSDENQIRQRCRKANVFRCEDCPKIFPSRASLRKHKRVHSDEMSFTCAFCQQKFKYKGSLNRHVKEQHYGLGRKGIRRMFDEIMRRNRRFPPVGNVHNLRSVECSFEEENGENHIEPKRNFSVQENDDFKEKLQPEPDAYLDAKQENFAHDDSLDLAKSTEEEGSFEIKKQNLDKARNEFDSSETELLEKQKMFKCKDCPRMFWNSSELRKHAYKHTDVKSFACRLCDKAFKFRSGLVRHNRNEHKKTDLTRSEINGCDMGENNSDEAILQKKVERSSIFCGQVEPNGRLKRKFSKDQDGENDIDVKDGKFCKGDDRFKTKIVERSEIQNFEYEENSFGGTDPSSNFGTDVEGTGEGDKTITDQTLALNEKGCTDEEMSIQSVCQNVLVKKRSAVYNCNKCVAVFKQLCDFLTHQRIHK